MSFNLTTSPMLTTRALTTTFYCIQSHRVRVHSWGTAGEIAKRTRWIVVPRQPPGLPERPLVWLIYACTKRWSPATVTKRRTATLMPTHLSIVNHEAINWVRLLRWRHSWLYLHHIVYIQSCHLKSQANEKQFITIKDVSGSGGKFSYLQIFWVDKYHFISKTILYYYNIKISFFFNFLANKQGVGKVVRNYT